jgi:hypothetical protein
MSDLTKEEKSAAASHLRFAAEAYANARCEFAKTLNLFPSGTGLVSAMTRELIARGCTNFVNAIDECDNIASKLENRDE